MTNKKSPRSQYISIIMKKKYADDDDKYYDQNLAFLETLDLKELSRLASEDEDEEDEDIDDEL